MRITKRYLLAAIIGGLSMNAYAVAPGFYLGFAAGPATNNANEQTVPTMSGTPPTTIAKPYSQQFASHIYMGNKVNDYVSAEFGFTYFSSIGYSSQYETAGGLASRVRDIDLVAKLGLPVGNAYEVFVKGGPAYTYLTTSGGLSTQGKTRYQSKVAPLLGLGASYDLSQNWVIDLTANALFAGGSVGRATYVGLGLSYHFVSKYCGQFLCDD